SATDVEDGLISPSATSNTVVANTPGTYEVIWSATDSDEDTGTATRVVTVVDTTAPVVTVPADIVVEANTATGSIVTFTPTATDVSDSAPVITAIPASGTFFNIGTHTVSVTATDASGNTSVASTFTVTVTDQRYLWSTLAGTPDVPNTEGFATPQGVAVDTAGIVYVADTLNHVIRKISPTGEVSLLAGGPISGSADGSGVAAQFDSPYGLIVDPAGNVYVADTSNHNIRKITPEGVVTTVAGLAGAFGDLDGTGTSARFFQPTGLALDSAGNLLVADYGNHRIRKIDLTTGAVITLAGSSQGYSEGTGTDAQFDGPFNLAINDDDEFFVADSNNSLIRKVTAAGVVTTHAGTGEYGSDDGDISMATFGSPTGIAVDSSGNLFVTDYSGDVIRKISPFGVVTTIGGLFEIPGHR
ncbi:MAG: HYR domain-containing protein, partial [Rhodococcus sp. (in: high G+C Gram-positive bacteria)]